MIGAGFFAKKSNNISTSSKEAFKNLGKSIGGYSLGGIEQSYSNPSFLLRRLGFVFSVSGCFP